MRGARIGPLALEPADLLRERVAARLQLLGARLQRLALAFERAEPRRVEEGLRRLACVEAGEDLREVLAQERDVEHGNGRVGQGAEL